MILRRVIAHFRKQEWTAIALDFLIVVVGILIAFQITGWNTGREESKRAEAALTALLSESRDSIAYLEDQIAAIDESITRQMASIEAIVSGELPPGMSHEQFVAGVTLTRRFLSPLPPRSTYDSLLANGDIGLIEDPNVLRELARYYAHVSQVHDYAARIAASERDDYHPAIISIYDPLSEDYRRQDADFNALAADAQFLEDSVDTLRSVVALQNARRRILETAGETYTILCAAAGSACEASAKRSPPHIHEGPR